MQAAAAETKLDRTGLHWQEPRGREGRQQLQSLLESAQALLRTDTPMYSHYIPPTMALSPDADVLAAMQALSGPAMPDSTSQWHPPLQSAQQLVSASLPQQVMASSTGLLLQQLPPRVPSTHSSAGPSTRLPPSQPGAVTPQLLRPRSGRDPRFAQHAAGTASAPPLSALGHAAAVSVPGLPVHAALAFPYALHSAEETVAPVFPAGINIFHGQPSLASQHQRQWSAVPLGQRGQAAHAALHYTQLGVQHHGGERARELSADSEQHMQQLRRWQLREAEQLQAKLQQEGRSPQEADQLQREVVRSDHQQQQDRWQQQPELRGVLQQQWHGPTGVTSQGTAALTVQPQLVVPVSNQRLEQSVSLVGATGDIIQRLCQSQPQGTTAQRLASLQVLLSHQDRQGQQQASGEGGTTSVRGENTASQDGAAQWAGAPSASGAGAVSVPISMVLWPGLPH